MAEHDEWIGTEWADRDKREPGRVIRITGVVDDLTDGWGGPVFEAETIARRGQPVTSGRRRTEVGLHGLTHRWRRMTAPPSARSES